MTLTCLKLFFFSEIKGFLSVWRRCGNCLFVEEKLIVSVFFQFL